MVPSVLAASASWPVLVLGVIVATALCLWLLFRAGSIGDRARDDHADEGPDVDGHDREPGPLR